MQDTILKIQNISKFYPGVTALNNVSFEIKAGEARALCGENGAGKSTLIKCIMGVERPDEGKVLMNYNGDWIENTSALEAQSHGVYANYQHVNIAPDLSIAEKDSYEIPAIFNLIAKTGNIAEEMMYNTFNMGIGMVVAVDEKDVDATIKAMKEAGDEAFVVGKKAD